MSHARAREIAINRPREIKVPVSDIRTFLVVVVHYAIVRNHVISATGRQDAGKRGGNRPSCCTSRGVAVCARASVHNVTDVTAFDVSFSLFLSFLLSSFFCETGSLTLHS